LYCFSELLDEITGSHIGHCVKDLIARWSPIIRFRFAERATAIQLG